MASKPPVKRRDPMAPESTGVGDVSAEIRAQLATHEERKAEAKRKAEREKRPRMTYDLPAKVIQAIKEIADQEDVAQSDLVALALIDLVDDYRAGRVTLAGLKDKARSLRFGYHLTLPAEWR